MTTFTFAHNTWEIPSDVDVIVRLVEDHDPPLWDFDFHRNGEIIPAIGGTYEDGTAVPNWEDRGIRKVDRVRYEDLL